MTHRKNFTRRFGTALAATLLAAFLVPALAGAQGAFFVEETKDGRIYVFNVMKEYDHWKKTGEMGKSITRVGEGPNGETIVFDSNEAIHLYNFRHGKPGEVLIVPEEKKPTMKFGWKDGKTTFESDAATLVLANRVQVRYTHEDPEVGDSKDSFRMRRVRTKMDGWIYSKDLTYELQVDWADATNSYLLDANVNYDLTGTKAFQVKAGQFKVPFGRQELTSSGSLQFVDRSIVSAEFAKGRDLGLQFWGLALGETIDWRVGVFNGAGRNKVANDNDGMQYDARVTWQPFGDVKYSESDFESKDGKFLFALAGQYEKNDLHGATAGNDVAREVVGVDVVAKWSGLSVAGEWYDRDNDPETGADSKSDGLSAQVGYFLVPGTFELAARWASWDPSDLAENDDRTETGVALNWFFNKHNLKLQADLRQVEDEKTDTKNKEARLQFQFIF